MSFATAVLEITILCIDFLFSMQATFEEFYELELDFKNASEASHIYL